MNSFEEFPKIARLSRASVITEKLDGTNAQVFVLQTDVPSEEDFSHVPWIAEVANLKIAAGSRNKYITPKDDNYSFAKWVEKHVTELLQLGPGRYYGEWWGSGIQRGYGLVGGEKRFSLFNTARWADVRDDAKFPQPRPLCCGVVPVLYTGIFSTEAVENAVQFLRERGSVAAPGFTRPEGVVIWHEAARVLFKKTIEKDEEPKGKNR